MSSIYFTIVNIMSSGEFMRAAEITRDTLRHYVNLGLLTPSVKEANGYRIYTDHDLEKVEFIKSAQKIGFTLHQTDEIYRNLSMTDCMHQSMIPLLETRVHEIDKNISNLKKVRKHLNSLIKEFKGRDCNVNPSDLKL